ncbi:MAG TPA: hypothetical protein VF029_01825 [Actinomycetota bacterium]
MEPWVWVALIVAAAVVVAAVAWLVYRRRRTSELRDWFGSEYDRTVSDADSRAEGETELQERRERRERVDVRPLTAESRGRYLDAWEAVQARFVDAPAVALARAEALAVQVMHERGYPVDDFDQQVAVVSVDHPDVIAHLRAGRAVVERAEVAEADTEELRQGLMHYRALFDRLLEDGPAPQHRAG